ncbi:hypothetical protein [Soonwooa sp.]|uniref:hypothetical protein n=1 Tax=Soonwooa sp. TaxID=1938592 RepID=UPI002619A539|nr:hypothetical protein [Soonwooa sp.]
MKKWIAIILCLVTIVVSAWFFINQMNSLDIPSNKNDQFAAQQKWEIQERKDIDNCEKEKLIAGIDAGRALDRKIAGHAFEKQVFAIFIIITQIIILIVVSLMPRNVNKV